MGSGRREVAHFCVPYTGFFDSDGCAVAEVPEVVDRTQNMAAIYRDMVLTRAFDVKAVSLQRTGRV